MSDGVIDPTKIPIPEADLDAVEAAGGDLKSDGDKVSQAGQDIKSAWSGLEGVYIAPESDILLTAVDPVAAKGDEFDTNITMVGDALIGFAEEARPILERLRSLKTDAENFVAGIKDDDDWQKDEDKTEEHNQLNNDVLAALADYMEAERNCANKITAIFGGTTFVATDPNSDSTLLGRGEQAYGYTEAPQDVQTPWATPQEHDAPWWEDTWNGGVDFVVGIAEDLGGMVGLYGENGWGVSSWGEWGDNLADNYGGMLEGFGALAGFYGENGWGVGSWGEWWGNFSTGWTEFAHAIVPWREWGDRPGYVITQGVLNIGSMFIGAGVIKGIIQGGRRAGGNDSDSSGGDGADSDSPAIDTADLPGRNPGDLPSTQNLQDALDGLNIDAETLDGLDSALDDAADFGSRNEREYAPVGGGDPPVDDGSSPPPSSSGGGNDSYEGPSGDTGNSGSDNSDGGTTPSGENDTPGGRPRASGSDGPPVRTEPSGDSTADGDNGNDAGGTDTNADGTGSDADGTGDTDHDAADTGGTDTGDSPDTDTGTGSDADGTGDTDHDAADTGDTDTGDSPDADSDTGDGTDSDNDGPRSGFIDDDGRQVDIGHIDEQGRYIDGNGDAYVEPPTSARALEQYQQIRDTEGDTERISENTGIDRGVLDRIKNHIFESEHPVAMGPNEIRVGRFSPWESISELWLKAERGTLDEFEEVRFNRWVNHEGVESLLMENGIPYRSAHPDYWDGDSVAPSADHHGAHDLAPNEGGLGPFRHYPRLLGRDDPGFEIAPDRSNLDELVDLIMRDVDMSQYDNDPGVPGRTPDGNGTDPLPTAGTDTPGSTHNPSGDGPGRPRAAGSDGPPVRTGPGDDLGDDDGSGNGGGGSGGDGDGDPPSPSDDETPGDENDKSDPGGKGNRDFQEPGPLGDDFKPDVVDHPTDPFKPHEREIADLRAEEGRHVTAIEEDHTRSNVPNPDALERSGPDDPGRLVEYKTIEGEGWKSVDKQLRKSLKKFEPGPENIQDGDIVIDGRNTVSTPDALQGMENRLRQDLEKGGPKLNQVGQIDVYTKDGAKLTYRDGNIYQDGNIIRKWDGGRWETP